MVVRLFCDIIAASRVKDSLDDVVLICKNNNRMGADHFFKDISEVPITVNDCVRHQGAYTKRGLGGYAFLGFCGKDWTTDDFESYFESNPNFYRHVSKGKYMVKLGDSFRKLDGLENGAIQACITDFCFSLLTQETYNPRLLAKFGLDPFATRA